MKYAYESKDIRKYIPKVSSRRMELKNDINFFRNQKFYIIFSFSSAIL